MDPICPCLLWFGLMGPENIIHVYIGFISWSFLSVFLFSSWPFFSSNPDMNLSCASNQVRDLSSVNQVLLSFVIGWVWAVWSSLKPEQNLSWAPAHTVSWPVLWHLKFLRNKLFILYQITSCKTTPHKKDQRLSAHRPRAKVKGYYLILSCAVRYQRNGVFVLIE